LNPHRLPRKFDPLKLRSLIKREIRGKARYVSRCLVKDSVRWDSCEFVSFPSARANVLRAPDFQSLADHVFESLTRKGTANIPSNKQYFEKSKIFLDIKSRILSESILWNPLVLARMQQITGSDLPRLLALAYILPYQP